MQAIFGAFMQLTISENLLVLTKDLAITRLFSQSTLAAPGNGAFNESPAANVR